MERNKKDRYEEVCQEVCIHEDVVNFVTAEMPEEETLYQARTTLRRSTNTRTTLRITTATRNNF